MAGRRTIAAAIVGCAQMRAALEHPARNLVFRLARIVAEMIGPTTRVLRDAAGLQGISRMFGSVEVAGPFPDVADQIVNPIGIRREGGDRRGPLIAVELRILERKRTLPGIRHLPAAGRQLLAPGELRL